MKDNKTILHEKLSEVILFYWLFAIVTSLWLSESIMRGSMPIIFLMACCNFYRVNLNEYPPPDVPPKESLASFIAIIHVLYHALLLYCFPGHCVSVAVFGVGIPVMFVYSDACTLTKAK